MSSTSLCSMLSFFKYTSVNKNKYLLVRSTCIYTNDSEGKIRVINLMFHYEEFYGNVRSMFHPFYLINFFKAIET